MAGTALGPRTDSPDTLELALNVLAMEGGRPTRASETLALQGIKLNKQRLHDWKTRYADRYNEICENLQDQRAQRMAAAAEDVALRAAELELELLEDLRTKKHDLKPAELAGAVRNVTTTKTLNVEKVINPLRNRPSRITEHRNAAEVLNSLEARYPQAIDTTATEITEDDDSASV